VEVDRPPPGEVLNDGGEVTVPRQAAGVIVARGAATALELLLVQRTSAARFMGGVWVFPGGAVDTAEAEADGDVPHRSAAIRELREEAGIAIDDPAQLVAFSRWITPAEVVIRYDSRFFLAALPPGGNAIVDGDEIVDHRWLAPQAALDAHARGELLLVFPTIKDLERLARHDSADAALAAARAEDVAPTQPRVVTKGGRSRVVLPGEPGYEDP
jgi:8-oxo-dGTP pyrophosphatase MutT (NUDIX family)